MVREGGVIYTLVRHSGYTVGGNEQFAHGVELCAIPGALVMKVIGLGGLIFNSYSDADRAESRYNYPEGYAGVIPNAKGNFKVMSYRLHTYHIFIPEHTGNAT